MARRAAILIGGVSVLAGGGLGAEETQITGPQDYSQYFSGHQAVDTGPVLEVTCGVPKKYRPDDPTEGYRGGYMTEIEGWAIVGLNIEPDGELSRHKIYQTSTPRLYKHIRRCLRNTSFRPASLGDQAVGVENYPAKIVFEDEKPPVIVLGLAD